MNNNLTQECYKCNLVKDLIDFIKNKKSKNGFSKICKECKSKEYKYYFYRNYESNRKNQTIYQQENKEKINEKARARYKKIIENEETKTEYKNKVKKQKKKYKDKISKRRIEQKRERTKTDIQFRISSNLRSSFRGAIKRGYKNSSVLKLLGCSVLDFKKYIESLWLPGMSWENWGKGEGKWNLDHIIPCVAFDLRYKSQQEKCYYYTNLRPLWEIDNICKNDYLENNTRARDISYYRKSEEGLDELISEINNIS